MRGGLIENYRKAQFHEKLFLFISHPGHGHGHGLVCVHAKAREIELKIFGPDYEEPEGRLFFFTAYITSAMLIVAKNKKGGLQRCKRSDHGVV